jgi:8-oxo-dGDP phosphatase
MQDAKIEILRDEVIYEKGYTRIVVRHFRDKDGAEKEWGMVHVNSRPPGALLFALSADGKVIVERSWRIPVGASVYELPGGLNDKEHEKPEDVVRRELLEETGYEASGELIFLAEVADAPGMTDERSRIFFTRDAKKRGEPHTEAAESIETILIVPEDIPKLALSDKVFCDPKLIAAWALARDRGLIP